MIYLKKFDTETNYLAYRNDKVNYQKPNNHFVMTKRVCTTTTHLSQRLTDTIM